MKKFEYRQDLLGSEDSEWHNSMEHLNFLGNEGWEVINVVVLNGFVYVFLKRIKE